MRSMLDDTAATSQLREIHAPGLSDEQRGDLRRQVVEHYLPRVVRVARRFHDRGEPQRDLDQVAAVGLLKAVDGFDPDRGVPFLGYLIPTVRGELKRYFRDIGWDVRVPRRLQELKLEVGYAVEDLTARFGREATVDEIARHLGHTAAEVCDATTAAHAYQARSLNEPVPGRLASGRQGGDIYERQDLLGGPDHHLEQATDRITLEALLRRLPHREAQLLALRFFDDLTQAEIGERLGVSQMQVSRLLTQVIGWLRGQMDGGHEPMPFDGTPRLRLRLVCSGRCLIARLQDPLDAAQVPQLRVRLVHAAVHLRPARLVVDLRRVTVLAPQALAALVAAQGACGHVHGRLLLLNAHPAVAVTLRRGGLGRLLVHTTPPPGEASRGDQRNATSLINVGSGNRPEVVSSSTRRRRWCWKSSPHYTPEGASGSPPPPSAA